MFELPPSTRQRRESKWQVFDKTSNPLLENTFEDVVTQAIPQRRSPRKSIWELSAENDERIHIVRKESGQDTIEDGTKKLKEAAVILEIMNLIDGKNTGMVVFPEFLEAITIKIMKDASVCIKGDSGYKGKPLVWLLCNIFIF